MRCAVVAVAIGLISPLPADAQARTWLGPLEVVDRIADGEGTLFGNPRMIRGCPRGGFVLADWGEHSVREYSPTGELLWRVGRRGEGPGEFSAIMDLEFDATGNLLVLGRANRVTIVNPSGSVVATKGTPEGNQILPAGFTSGWATLAADRMQALWTSDSRTVRMPRGVSCEAAIVGERWAANAPDGESVVFHRWSDLMIISSWRPMAVFGLWSEGSRPLTCRKPCLSVVPWMAGRSRGYRPSAPRVGRFPDGQLITLLGLNPGRCCYRPSHRYRLFRPRGRWTAW